MFIIINIHEGYVLAKLRKPMLNKGAHIQRDHAAQPHSPRSYTAVMLNESCWKLSFHSDISVSDHMDAWVYIIYFTLNTLYCSVRVLGSIPSDSPAA